MRLPRPTVRAQARPQRRRGMRAGLPFSIYIQTNLCYLCHVKISVPSIFMAKMIKKISNTLKGKKVLLTGATGGVGKEVAKKLREAGANLLLISKDEGKLKDLQKTLFGDKKLGEIKYLALDFNNLDDVERAIPEIISTFGGHIDILINNAGMGYHGKIETIDTNELKEVFTINVLSPIIITSRLLSIISKSDAGHIVNISSILGSRSMERTASYTASKHALTGFTKVLRQETARRKIRVTTIEPGAINTQFVQRTHESEAKDHFSERKLIKIPPETIASWIIKVIESDPMVCPEVIQIMPQEQII